jgi:hypothetical protein
MRKSKTNIPKHYGGCRFDIFNTKLFKFFVLIMSL